MTNISSQNTYSSMLNNFSNKIKDPKEREEFKKTFESNISDSDGLTEKEVDSLKKFFEPKDQSTFSKEASKFVGTKTITGANGIISSKDKELLDALGKDVLKDGIVTPDEAKGVIKKAEYLSESTKSKLLKIAESTREYVVSDNVQESNVKVNRIVGNTPKKEKVVVIEGLNKSDGDNLSLNNTVVVSNVSNSDIVAKKQSGESIGEAVDSVVLSTGQLDPSKVIPSHTVSVNIPILPGQTPKEALIQYLKETSEKNVYTKDKRETLSSNGNVVSVTNKVKGAKEDTMPNRELNEYTRPITVGMNGKEIKFTRDGVTRAVFPNAKSNTQSAVFVEGLRNGKVTPEGITFIKSVRNAGLLKGDTFTEKDFRAACSAIGLRESDVTGGKIGAEYITKYQEAVVKKVGDLIEPFNAANEIFVVGNDGKVTIDKSKFEAFKSKYGHLEDAQALIKAIDISSGNLDAVKDLSLSDSNLEDAKDKFQDSIRAKLGEIHKMLDTSNPFAKHPILQELREQINPEELKGKKHIVKPTPEFLTEIVKKESDVSSSLIVSSTDLKVKDGAIVGTVTFGAMKRDN